MKPSMFLSKFGAPNAKSHKTKKNKIIIFAKVFFLINEYSKHNLHKAYCQKFLCYRRATSGKFVMSLVYSKSKISKDVS